MGNLIRQWRQPNDLCVKSGPNIEDCSLYRPPSGIAIAATRVSGACEEKLSNKKKWQLFFMSKVSTFKSQHSKRNKGRLCDTFLFENVLVFERMYISTPNNLQPRNPGKKARSQPTHLTNRMPNPGPTYKLHRESNRLPLNTFELTRGVSFFPFTLRCKPLVKDSKLFYPNLGLEIACYLSML